MKKTIFNNKSLIQLLNTNNIKYTLYNHPPLFTVEDSKKMRGYIKGAHTKNLFLKNKKNEFFLITCLESSAVDLKLLKKNINMGNISFAGEKYLKSLMNVNPGSVTPFGLLNDFDFQIKFFFDIKLNEYNSFNFHPLVNTSTINIDKNDFYSFFLNNNINITLLNLNTFETKNV